MTTSDGSIGWAILAPGKIASSFCTDLALVPDAALVAVGSREPSRAEAFAAEHAAAAHGDPVTTGGYAEALADSRIDVVYIASPNSFHVEQTLLALRAGKAVLCEKPLTLDSTSSATLVADARSRGLFLMEAAWTRTHPVVLDLGRRVQAGEFGHPLSFEAHFRFAAPDDPGHRLLDPALGGGALLDLGMYPLTVAEMLLGEPESLSASGIADENGIDLDVLISGKYPGGASAQLSVSIIEARRNTSARLVTDAGMVELPEDFHHPRSWLWHPNGGETVTMTAEEPVIGRGYGNEIVEVGRCLRAGLTESPLMPLDTTLRVMAQLDDFRRAVLAE